MVISFIIEIISYCVIPTIIRLLNKKPLKNKTAWYISVANYGGIFTIYRLIISKMLNIEYNNISPDLLSLVLVPINVYILKLDINKTKSKRNKSNKNALFNKKTIISILLIICITILSIVIITSNNKNKENNNTNNNSSSTSNQYIIKSLETQKDFDKVISNKNYTIVLFDFQRDPFHDSSINTIEQIIKDFKLTNVYYYDIYNGNINAKTEIDKLPSVVIYKQNNFVAEKVGYTKQQNELAELYYRTEILDLLESYNIISYD